jgi:hypothetical protein
MFFLLTRSGNLKNPRKNSNDLYVCLSVDVLEIPSRQNLVFLSRKARESKVFTSNLRIYLNQPVFHCHFLSSSCHHSDYQWKSMNAFRMRKYLRWIVTQHNLMFTLTCWQEKKIFLFFSFYHVLLS